MGKTRGDVIKIHSFNLTQGGTSVLIQSKIPSWGILRRLYEPPSASAPPQPQPPSPALPSPQSLSPPALLARVCEVNRSIIIGTGYGPSTFSLHLKPLSPDAPRFGKDLHSLLDGAPQVLFISKCPPFSDAKIRGCRKKEMLGAPSSGIEAVLTICCRSPASTRVTAWREWMPLLDRFTELLG